MTITRHVSKRRKQSESKSQPQNINDAVILPPLSHSPPNLVADAWANVTTFLLKSECALLAAAIDNSQYPSACSACKSIVATAALHHGGWGSLDFADIAKSLAAKLNDEDILEILVSINAVDTVKSLKLTHCVGIVGHGLVSLRGSVVLEQLDLSLVGPNESPSSSLDDPMIRPGVVVPILYSIIDKEGTSMKHLQLPKKWRDDKSQVLGSFLSTYNRVLNDRQIVCCGSACDKVCNRPEHSPWVTTKGGYAYGKQRYTCFACLGTFCDNCDPEFEVKGCSNCESVFALLFLKCIALSYFNCSFDDDDLTQAKKTSA